MKIACDRCSKIIDADDQKVPNGWLSLKTDLGLVYIFCEKCSDVFWDTMFNYNNDELKEGEQDD